MNDNNLMALPNIGDQEIRILNETTIELINIVGKPSVSSPVTDWNFVNSGVFSPPTGITVLINGASVPIINTYFRSRPIYISPKLRDIRIGSHLFLTVANIPDNASVQVSSSTMSFLATKLPTRYSPVIHTSHLGYLPNSQKLFMVGYYLGNGGELPISAVQFKMLDSTSKVVFTGSLVARKDVGFAYTPTPYQAVLQGDFTSFVTEGTYTILIDNLGTSFPVIINKNLAICYEKTLAKGMMQQQSNHQVGLPDSRFLKNADHHNPAYIPVPDASFSAAWYLINSESDGEKTMPNSASLIYPYVNQGTVDVSGGFLDAGDYSRYMYSSPILVHALTFAADNLANTPSNGLSADDLLTLANWEANYVYRMQDADGGFYTFIYPKTRPYESDASLRGNNFGDDQFVAPKTMWATANAVGLLAELGSSPKFIAKSPTQAAQYITAAKAGWVFIQNAIAKYGMAAFQHLRNSPLDFYDSLIYAAASLWAATNDPIYHTQLLAWLPDPNKTPWEWEWKIMDNYYGCGLRCYAFSVRSGRRLATDVNATYLAACETQIGLAGDKVVRDGAANAYGVSYALDDKGFNGGTVGWFFPATTTFDLAVAYAINPKPEYVSTCLANVNFTCGCNPVNISSLAGVGYIRPRIFVNQYSNNDYHAVPPTGMLKAAISNGVGMTTFYTNPDGTNEIPPLIFPAEYDFNNKYSIYDRLETDCWNTDDEITSTALVLAKGLAAATWLSRVAS